MRRSFWPTRRAAIVVGGGGDNSPHWQSVDQIEQQARAAARRGCVAVDLVGGEPAQHPQLEQIRATLEALDLHGAIFCSCRDPRALRRALDLSIWEVICVSGDSRQDLPADPEEISRVLEDYPALVRLKWFFKPTTFAAQKDKLRAWLDFLRPSYLELVYSIQPWRLAAKRNWPTSSMVDWPDHIFEIYEEAHDTGVRCRIRYVPMCLFPGCETDIVNIPQMLFDPLSWDYEIEPKEPEIYLSEADRFCRQFNIAHGPCGSCFARKVCGGAARSYVREAGLSGLKPFYGEYDDPLMFVRKRWGTVVVDAGAGDVGVLLDLAEEPCRVASPEVAKEAVESGEWPYVWLTLSPIEEITPSWNAFLGQILEEADDLRAVAPVSTNVEESLESGSGLALCDDLRSLAGVLVRAQDAVELLDGNGQEILERLVEERKVAIAGGVRVRSPHRLEGGWAVHEVERTGVGAMLEETEGTR